MAAKTPDKRPLSIAYLFLEPYVEGHGAYAHAAEIIGRLDALGHEVRLYAHRYRRGVALPGAVRRLANILGVQLRMLLPFGPGRP